MKDGGECFLYCFRCYNYNEGIFRKLGCLASKKKFSVYVLFVIFFAFWCMSEIGSCINVCFYDLMSHYQSLFSAYKTSSTKYISTNLYNNSFFFVYKYKERVMALTTEKYFSYNWINHVFVEGIGENNFQVD